MSERFGEIIHSICSALAVLAGLCVPVIVVLWLIGRWGDQAASAGVILACFLAALFWLAGRLVLNGIRGR